jgi:hypothetical protein
MITDMENFNLFNLMLHYWGVHILIGVVSLFIITRMKFSKFSIFAVGALTVFFPLYSMLFLIVPLMVEFTV